MCKVMLNPHKFFIQPKFFKIFDEFKMVLPVREDGAICPFKIVCLMVEFSFKLISLSHVEKDILNIVINDKGLIKKYKLFYSDNCPGCPPVKNFLKQVHLSGEEINAGTREGFEEAIRNNITGTPTVLFFNDAGDVVNKAHTPAQIERLIA